MKFLRRYPRSAVWSALFVALSASGARAQGEPQPDRFSREDILSEYLVGVYKKSAGDVLESVDHLEFSWRMSGHDPEVGMKLAESYYLLKNFTRCEMVLDETLDIVENHRDALMLKAKVRYIKRDRRSAVLCLEQVREHHAGTFEAERLLGNIYYEMGESEQAAAAYKRCLSVDASYPYIQYRYGRLLAEAGDLDGAEKALRRAISLDSEFTEPAVELAQLLARQERTDEAIGVLEVVVESEKGDSEVATALVNFYVESGRLVDGIVLLEKRRAGGGLTRDNEVLLGRLLFEAERYGEATGVFSALLKREPQSAELARILAEIQLKSGDPAGARQYFEQAIAIGPGDYRSYLALFFASSTRFTSAVRPIELKKGEGALLLGEAALKVPGQDFDGNYMLGLAYLSVDSVKAAETHLLRAREVKRDDRGVLLNLANVYEKQRRFDSAIEYLEPLLAQTPDDPSVLNFYGYILAELGRDLDRAAQMIGRALEIEPDNGYYLDSLGWVYYQQGNYAESVKALERASVRVGEDPTILEHLGDAYTALRYFDKAITAYERSNRLQGGSDSIVEKIESATRKR